MTIRRTSAKVPSRFGPGFLVAAAFMGPGTLTTASVAGAGFGTALLWAILFSIVATIVLQEMSARLGLVTRSGLGEVLRSTFSNRLLRLVTILLVVTAIAFGNAAFEMGNILGAAIGLQAWTGMSESLSVLVVGISAFLMLALGAYLSIERLCMALVGLMGCVFLLTALISRPDIGSIVAGMLRPSIPPHSMITIIALIGTTVVPYNLFLHASSVQEKWGPSVPLERSLRMSLSDAVISIGLGGLITMAILVTAAAVHGRSGRIDSVAAMADQLEPLLGPAANTCFFIGLTAAGLTSAITAPLAAAYATAGVLGFSGNIRSWKFRAVWGMILTIGTTLALLGWRPVEAIVFAQAANGILLPILAGLLLVAMNRKSLLGKHTNGWIANSLGIAIVMVVAILGLFQILRVLGVIDT